MLDWLHPLPRITSLKAKNVFSGILLSALLSLNFLHCLPAETAEMESSPLTSVMKEELNRCFAGMKGKGDAHIYFLSYRINDSVSSSIYASDGALTVDEEAPLASRAFHVEVRVGGPNFDNTHNSKECSCEDGEMLFYGVPVVPTENNNLAVRSALWQLSEAAYRKAQTDYARESASRLVDVQNQDKSNDFSIQRPHVFSEPARPMVVDRKKWQERVRNWSTDFKKFPHILSSQLQLRAEEKRVYYVNSEGTQVEQNDPCFSISFRAEAKLPDGMTVWLFDDIPANNLAQLEHADVNARIARLGKTVEQLCQAKPAEPYSGPAILRGKAAAVFFHEVFGHRAEGHRQKDESEGQTFTKKLGTKIMPSFISILDDPTLSSYHGVSLVGKYKYDDEGVPAQKVTLVDHGILKAFLMGRSPIEGFSASNGHGRCSSEFRPVARQAIC